MNTYRNVLFIVTLTPACWSSRVASQGPSADSPSQPPNKLASDARRLLLGEGVPRDRTGALALYFDACKQGDARSCSVVITSTRAGDERRFAAADALWPRCKSGHVWSCRVTSSAVRDFDAAETQIRSACADNNPFACTAQAAHTSDAALFTKACQLGDPEACDLSAASQPRDRERAGKLRAAGCRAGYARDCQIVGDEANYRRMSIDRCLEGNLEDCNVAISKLPEDRATASGVLEMACALDTKNCRRLADFHLAPEHRLVEPAREALALLCTEDEGTQSPAGHPVSLRLAQECLGAAKLYAEDPPDPAKAQWMRERACTLGERTACITKP